MAETIVAWPTLIGVERLALPSAMNANLRTAALEVEQRARPPGDHRHFSNTVDNHTDIFPERFRGDLDTLWGQVAQAAQLYLQHAFRLPVSYPLSWSLCILVARPGDRLPAHSHPQRDLFAAYYPHIDPPADDPTGMHGGELRFIDNRGWGRKWVNRNPSLFDSAYLSLRPEPGMLVIAPGYALHETNPFSGPGLRVTYGFFMNVLMTKEYAA